MKHTSLTAKTMVLLLGLLTSVGCGIRGTSLRATLEAEVRPIVAKEVWQTAEVKIETTVTAMRASVAATQTAQVTPTATPLPPIEVALKSFHGRYVTAMGEDDNWALGQDTELNNCGWFTQHHLANGKIALVTCHDKYVTAPETGTERQDWMLGQESKLGNCGQFDLYDLGRDGVALETCARRFVTAGDGDWPGELRWSLVGEADTVKEWERFKILQLYTPPPPVLADFDDCKGVTNRGEPTGTVYDPSSDDRIVVSFVQEARPGCIARLEYDMVGWSGFWIRLGDADLSPYSQLVFDVKADSQEVPERVKIELKRAGGREVSILYISGITTDWQTMRVNLGDFEGSLSSFTDMEELVFVFEVNGSRKTGVIYLDNIALR